MVIGTVKNWMEDAGIQTQDIPTALLMFKGLAFTTNVGLVVLAVRYRPARFLFRSGYPAKLKASFKKAYPGLWKKTSGHLNHYGEKISSYRFTQSTLGYYQTIKPKRGESLVHFQKRRGRDMGVGIAEGFLWYKLLLPIWAPVYLFAILRMYRRKQNEQNVNLKEDFDRSVEGMLTSADTDAVYDTSKRCIQAAPWTQLTPVEPVVEEVELSIHNNHIHHHNNNNIHSSPYLTTSTLSSSMLFLQQEILASKFPTDVFELQKQPAVEISRKGAEPNPFTEKVVLHYNM